ncbi:MAG: hypothetical protein IPJ97_18075, partial [Proteobacteria bacterium]|nr:hypothetical protein [Pseudomonadota bacterium]
GRARALASDQDRILMGVRHKSRPIWGVQFHPESIGTEFGHRLLDNFKTLTCEYRRQNPPRRRCSDQVRPPRSPELYNVVPAPQLAETTGTAARGSCTARTFRCSTAACRCPSMLSRCSEPVRGLQARILARQRPRT